MSTALARQIARQDDDIDQILRELRKAPSKIVRNMRANRGPRVQKALVPQSAFLDRMFESIAAAEHKDPDTGEIVTVEKQLRVITLVDLMHAKKEIDEVLYQAAERYRKLASLADGKSQGIGSYGEFQQSSPANQRCLVNDKQMAAEAKFKDASRAAFATPTDEGRWSWDHQLIQCVLPALFSPKRGVTKAKIGAPRTAFKGGGQLQTTGHAMVVEVLHRLCLHFCFRQN